MTSLSPAEKAFVQAHLTADVQALLLGPQPAGLAIKRLAAQILARQKARLKLPAWYACDDLLFPPALSVEQASSEQTARYKASLVNGQLLLDLTGGMGVDTWAFAQRVGRVVYVEQQPELAELAVYNLSRLGVANVTIKQGNGIALLDRISDLTTGEPPESSGPESQRADWIYLDPHRRDEQGGKVIRLEDCEPDVSRPAVLTSLLASTNHLLLKTSPLIDISATVQQLAGSSSASGSPVEAVHVVAVQGEVKEVLFVLRQDERAPEAITIQAVNLLPNGEVTFSFPLGSERSASIPFGDPERYVYEPNAAVLKAGAFRLVAARFGLSKLAPNSHLYTSNELRADFPGRIFVMQACIKPDAKLVRKLIPARQANLTVRNFPQSVAALRKQLTLREGGTDYILATTLLNGDKRLLITQKVDQAGLSSS